ncbi:hypothetical protein KKG48_00730 [Patescibacteria group bacterium]|nr:hypothetical protein [Patescibacteria group bacterium]
MEKQEKEQTIQEEKKSKKKKIMVGVNSYTSTMNFPKQLTDEDIYRLLSTKDNCSEL